MGLKFNDLPEEMLLTIFLLHPMKTLVLLRAVCTLWDRIITRKYFFLLFLSRQRTSSKTKPYFLLQNACKSASLMDIETRIYHNIFGKNYECYGICDGLFCLSSTKDRSKAHSKILLWTPIFRRKLPTLKIKHSQHTHLFFGYHNGDYKVLKFIFFPRIYYVCVYSLSTDEWKVLKYDDLISSAFNRSYSKARLVNGSAYIVEVSGKSDRGIVSFDLNREIFRETKLPQDICHNDDFIMEEYGESLAIIGRVSKENENVVVIWVLRVSDDDSFSWDEMSVIKPEINSDCTFHPMGFINNEELVVWSTSCSFLYNVKNECQQRCSPDKSATMVRSSRNVKSSIGVGVVARLGDYNETRMYMMMKPMYSPIWRPAKKVGLASTSNKYDVLADSDDDL